MESYFKVDDKDVLSAAVLEKDVFEAYKDVLLTSIENDGGFNTLFLDVDGSNINDVASAADVLTKLDSNILLNSVVLNSELEKSLFYASDFFDWCRKLYKGGFQ